MVWFGMMTIYQKVLPYVSGLFKIDHAISFARMIVLAPTFGRPSWHAYSFQSRLRAMLSTMLSSVKDSILSCTLGEELVFGQVQ